jgi:hypothetical protein
VSRFVSLSRAAIVVLLVSCLVPAGAAAASGGISVFVGMGDQCVTVAASHSTTVTGRLVAPSGAFLGARHATVGDLGAVELCYGQSIGPGERIKFTWSGATSGARTVTIPRLSVHADRVHDVVSGLAPAGSTVELDLTAADWRVNAGSSLFRDAIADAHGRYQLDVSADRNIVGGDGIAVDIRRASDIFHVFVAVPYIRLTLRHPEMEAQLEPYQDATFTLTSASRGPKGRAHLLGGPTAGAEGTFWRNAGGTFVTPMPGDRVASDLAGDASFRVPRIDLTASASSDVVAGSCVGAPRYAITMSSPGGTRSGSFVGTPASDGSFSHDFAGDPDIQPGDTAVVECIRATGDRVARLIRAS